MRTTYKNGDPCGATGCDGCAVSMMTVAGASGRSSIVCHEHGCPDAWRDHAGACFECGAPVYSPQVFNRSRGARVYCDDCGVDHA